MKAAILAGGLGTRLHPCTLATNKHLLPVYDRPMIVHVIETVKRAGCDHIKVIVGGPHAADVVRVLADGAAYGIRVEYGFQEGEGGIAAALALCKEFAKGEPLFVALGDNITDEDFAEDVQTFRGGAKVFLKKMPDAYRFGVPTLHDGHIAFITEKPETPASSFAVIGYYIYDAGVYDNIAQLKPSARGELEITDVNNIYSTAGQLAHREIDGYWTDAGTFDTLLSAGMFFARDRCKYTIVRRWTD